MYIVVQKHLLLEFNHLVKVGQGICLTYFFENMGICGDMWGYM